jgi:hypothetical protein
MTEQHIKESPVERVLDRLEQVKPCNGGYKALCPAHDDHNPSLSIGEGEDGRAVLHPPRRAHPRARLEAYHIPDKGP